MIMIVIMMIIIIMLMMIMKIITMMMMLMILTLINYNKRITMYSLQISKRHKYKYTSVMIKWLIYDN
jgi:hypothetical protein